jgi:hypothetical protein
LARKEDITMITGDFVNGLHLMVGLSTDTKPDTTSENTFFLEEDTGDVYYFSEGEWSKATSSVGKFISNLLGGNGSSGWEMETFELQTSANEREYDKLTFSDHDYFSDPEYMGKPFILTRPADSAEHTKCSGLCFWSAANAFNTSYESLQRFAVLIFNGEIRWFLILSSSPAHSYILSPLRAGGGHSSGDVFYGASGLTTRYFTRPMQFGVPSKGYLYSPNSLLPDVELREVLPDVTAADNGKVLGVKNGAWEKILGVYVVNGSITSQTGGIWTSDYSFDELTAAFLSGKTIQVQITGVGNCNAQWINSSDNLCAVTYMANTGGVVAFLASDGTFTIDTL